MIITRPHLSIRPTRYGLIFIIILAAMLAGSINYNNNAGFVLVFLLGGMAVISLYPSLQNLIGLDIGVIAAPPVFSGQSAAFHLRLSAGDRDRASLNVSLPGGDSRSETLEAAEDRRITVTTMARKRGIVSPETLYLSSVFPFGLFRIQTRVPFDMTCIIYPKPVPTDFEMGGGGSGLDGTVETAEQGPDDFQGLSLYYPGHDPKRIAWKAVSKGQGLFVKDFTAQADQFRMLDFDAFSATDTELRLSHLCDLILKAHSRHMSYGLILPGKKIAPSSGHAHKKRCLKALALFGVETTTQ